MSVIGDNAARWGAWLTSDLYDLGYSQPRRWSLVGVREGGSADADCSSLVAHCWNQGGAHPAFPADDGTWTGTLRELAAARGFSVMPYTAIGGDPANLMAGDALLSERASGGAGHVALYIGGGVLAEAWVDSHGSDGWDDPDEPVGDQTGQETRQIAYTDHSYTSAGLWTHVLRPPASPASGGGGSASKGGRGPLLGIDISNWQAGIDIAAVNPGFVIVQVTRGLEGINQYWREQATATRDQGRPVGLYHYVEGGGAAAEAARFIDEIVGWVGAAMICVDWESDDNAAWGDTDYLRRLITALKQRISGPVVLYGMASSYPWDIAREHGCGTWVAQYADSEPTGWDPAPWSDGTWTADMHQYTGTGHVPGWDGDLDLNVLPGGTDAWARLTGSPTTTTTTIGRTEDMTLIETRTPWGATAWALITQSSGATALDAQQAQAYNAALGRCGAVPWDHYQLLVREAWQRRNDLIKALGGEVRESVDAATTRVIAAVTARPAADTTTL